MNIKFFDFEQNFYPNQVFFCLCRDKDLFLREDQFKINVDSRTTYHLKFDAAVRPQAVHSVASSIVIFTLYSSLILHVQFLSYLYY